MIEMTAPVFGAAALGLFFGTGAVWHRAGIQVFSRLLFPVAIVFGVATAATYAQVPGIDFDLAAYLPSLRGIEMELAKGFGAGFLAALVGRFLWSQILIAQGSKGQRNTGRWASARKLYYETAIRLGVLTANADGNAEPREFEALENVFELSAFNAPNARGLYKSQLETPMPMSRVLQPFLKRFEPGCSACETLVLGMATIAAADTATTDSELGLVRMTAAKLGLSTDDANRLLASAGIGPGAQKARTERAGHLDTLGLNADATDRQIRKAHKRLASKYAPARLILLGLPDAERARADQIKAQIDDAYSALSRAA